jgi:hypothetical protein
MSSNAEFRDTFDDSKLDYAQALRHIIGDNIGYIKPIETGFTNKNESTKRNRQFYQSATAAGMF